MLCALATSIRSKELWVQPGDSLQTIEVICQEAKLVTSREFRQCVEVRKPSDMYASRSLSLPVLPDRPSPNLGLFRSFLLVGAIGAPYKGSSMVPDRV